MEQHISLADLPRVLKRDLGGMRRKVKSALVATAKAGVATCRANVPGEFREIAPGIEAFATPTGAVIRSNAPHSEAVELGKQRAKQWNGLPAAEDLAAWIRAHGSGRGKIATAIRKALKGYETRSLGSTGGSFTSAGIVTGQRDRRGRWVTSAKGTELRGGASQRVGRSSPTDAPLQLAWAIIGHINKHSAAHMFMGKSVPAIEADMDLRIQNALDSAAPLSDALKQLAASSSIGSDGKLGSGRMKLGAAARRLGRKSGRKAQ